MGVMEIKTDDSVKLWEKLYHHSTGEQYYHKRPARDVRQISWKLDPNAPLPISPMDMA